MIRRNITYKEKSLILPLYKAIVRPHLAYLTGMESTSQEQRRSHDFGLGGPPGRCHPPGRFRVMSKFGRRGGGRSRNFP